MKGKKLKWIISREKTSNTLGYILTIFIKQLLLYDLLKGIISGISPICDNFPMNPVFFPTLLTIKV